MASNALRFTRGAPKEIKAIRAENDHIIVQAKAIEAAINDMDMAVQRMKQVLRGAAEEQHGSRYYCLIVAMQRKSGSMQGILGDMRVSAGGLRAIAKGNAV